MFKIFFTKKAEKELDRLSSIDINRILEKLPSLSSFFVPESATQTTSLDIKKMSGVSGFYRLRLGKTRVIFEVIIKKEVIWIRKIGYRKDVYR